MQIHDVFNHQKTRVAKFWGFLLFVINYLMLLLDILYCAKILFLLDVNMLLVTIANS
jgi:hypothetical protein